MLETRGGKALARGEYIPPGLPVFGIDATDEIGARLGLNADLSFDSGSTTVMGRLVYRVPRVMGVKNLGVVNASVVGVLISRLVCNELLM